VSDHRYTEPPEYLQEAARCEEAARKCMSAANRKAYLKLAKEWRALAREAARPFHAPLGAVSNDCAPADDRLRLPAAE
jgi:hypothetical protein